MKIAFVIPYPNQTAASQRFRFEQYYQFLKEHKVRSYPFWSIKAWAILYKPGQKLQKSVYLFAAFLKRWVQVLFVLSTYDYIFIHREMAPIGPPIYEWILAKIFRKKIIYDFDDAIWLSNTSNANSIAAKLKFHSKVKHICKWAYKVSCGNQYLADFSKEFNENVIVNPTTIDTDYHTVNVGQRDVLNIGWTGTHSTLKYVFLLEDALTRLKKEFNFKFIIIADKDPELPFEYEFIKWNKTTEISDLQKFDIGVMPLEDNIWEKGKCGFKALQYMAVGIPAIVSPVAVNIKILNDEANGFFANDAKDWYEKLKELFINTPLREEKGKNAREYIEKHYSVKSNKENFINLFT